MVVRVRIKKDDFGMDYTFTIEGVDYSSVQGYTAKIYVWKGDTVLVDGGSYTNVLQGSDTVVTYTVEEDAFDTVGVWDAEIEFTQVNGDITFRERTETFQWEVMDSSPPTT